MLALGVGLTVLRAGEPERELGAEDRRDARALGRLGEAHEPREGVVVHEREGREPEAFGLLEQLLGEEAPSRKLKLEWACSSA
ncbi:hypothetical protein GCM10025869_31960 [Homoserinibacter gongjuensis]|uniref:Uncharacterized protein n=1 Tax=Homoserinibacter gongjuensis TaxID=1162968 RepID=A0ABQ6JWI7_9MICO|nr:hypothetical protein GCM10025869_31960 [Homoserinibacter gongjuensis]